MILADVYSAPDSARVLYDLLAEREPHQNISHKAMPSWESHVAFVTSSPYQAWYLIQDGGETVGAIYLTGAGEIGVGIFKKHHGKGYAKRAIAALIEKHGPRRYLANINPSNRASIALFASLGFTHLQSTYEFAPPDRR
jgi:RimJ/RimL family protein N-acetyltransferase